MGIKILGIESSCDDTSAAVIENETLLSNIVAGQKVHEEYGGVVPELASRAHQQNIVPVVDLALKKAGIEAGELDAVAFTRGPGLLGSLMVGTSFAKAFALARKIPIIEVDHLAAHVLALFIKEKDVEIKHPEFPYLCLLVSGGNSQIILAKDHYNLEVIGQTIDDAAGEAFDKCARIMKLPYPGGPVIDKLAKEGNPDAIKLARPKAGDLNYSFSGLKTSFLYTVRDELKKNEKFIEENVKDLCASLQKTIIDILMDKLIKASKETGIKEIAIAGGVSANSGLRSAVEVTAKENGWNTYIPKLAFTMDNAAMIAITGYYKYLKKDFAEQDIAPYARIHL